jgi:hypothetical protein
MARTSSGGLSSTAPGVAASLQHYHARATANPTGTTGGPKPGADCAIMCHGSRSTVGTSISSGKAAFWQDAPLCCLLHTCFMPTC